MRFLLPLLLLLGGCPAIPTGPFAAVAVGPGRICGLLEDGGLRCMGGEAAWTEDANAPPDDVAFASISLGTFHGCGLDESGVAHCWGPAGASVVDVPDELKETSFTHLAAGNSFTCGVRTAGGTLACWGFDPDGIRAPPGGTFGAVSLGDVTDNLCALDEDGVPQCWAGGARDAPERPLQQLGTGASHACGVDDDGGAVCWGDEQPWTDPPDVRASQVVGGINHSCLLTEDGEVVCFGAGPAIDRAAPTVRCASLDAGGHQTCGRTEEGAVFCWGLDSETGSFTADRLE